MSMPATLGEAADAIAGGRDGSSNPVAVTSTQGMSAAERAAAMDAQTIATAQRSMIETGGRRYAKHAHGIVVNVGRAMDAPRAAIDNIDYAAASLGRTSLVQESIREEVTKAHQAVKDSMADAEMLATDMKLRSLDDALPTDPGDPAKRQVLGTILEHVPPERLLVTMDNLARELVQTGRLDLLGAMLGDYGWALMRSRLGSPVGDNDPLMTLRSSVVLEHGDRLGDRHADAVRAWRSLHKGEPQLVTVGRIFAHRHLTDLTGFAKRVRVN